MGLCEVIRADFRTRHGYGACDCLLVLRYCPLHSDRFTLGHRNEMMRCALLPHLTVEEIAEAVAKRPPDNLARFRRWFTAFEAGRANHAEELDSAATKLGRLAGRAFAELKRRAKEP